MQTVRHLLRRFVYAAILLIASTGHCAYGQYPAAQYYQQLKNVEYGVHAVVQNEILTALSSAPATEGFAQADSLVRMAATARPFNPIAFELCLHIARQLAQRSGPQGQELAYLMRLHDDKWLARPEAQRILKRSLGTGFHSVGDLDRSRLYLLAYTALPAPDSLTRAHVNAITTLGIMYNSDRNFNIAEACLTTALRLARKMNDSAWIGLSHGNLGELYYAMGRYEEAPAHLRVDAGLSLRQQNFASAASGYKTLALIALKQRKLSQARQLVDSAILLLQKLTEENRPAAVQEMVFRTAAAYYEAVGAPAASLQYLTQAYTIRDSIHAQKSRSITRMKLASLEEAQERNTRADLESSRALQRKSNLVFATALIAALLIIALVLVLLYQQRRIHKMLVEKQQRALAEVKASALREAELNKLNATKNKLFGIVAHDLRGPLGNMHNVLESIEEGLLPERFIDMAVPMMRNQLAELTAMMNNLLYWAQAQQQGIRTQPQLMLVQPLVQKVVRQLRHAADEKMIAVQVQVSPDACWYADAQQMEVVLRNLLSNAIKFSQSGASVCLSDGVPQPGKTVLTVQDNGIGMSAAKMDNLFAEAHVGSTYGTAGEKGVGLGLQVCREFVKYNHGQIAVMAHAGGGTQFSISIPAEAAHSQPLKLQPEAVQA